MLQLKLEIWMNVLVVIKVAKIHYKIVFEISINLVTPRKSVQRRIYFSQKQLLENVTRARCDNEARQFFVRSIVEIYNL